MEAQGRTQGGGARGSAPRPVKGGGRKTQSYHTFKIWSWRMKNMKKNSLLFFFLVVLFEGET